MPGPSFQQLALRTLISLPTPVLRALSGGGVVYQGGRTLDPRFQFLAAQARGQPSLASLDPQVARAGSAAALQVVAGRPERGVRIEPLSIPGGMGPTAARAYRPDNLDASAPVMVFGHFGGGVIGDLDTSQVFCSILAKEARCAVVSVDYRLAPEHRFPAGLEDMLLAYRWAGDHAATLGAPAGKVAIGGDSMGGNFAAVVAQEMHRREEPAPVIQLLIYPALDVAGEGPAMTTYANAYPLDHETMEWFMGHYMGPEDSPDDPRLSPGRAQDLSGLAPAVIVTAGFDPLLDQGETYAKRLRDAKVEVAYRCFDHLPHAFTAFTGVSPQADRACREIAYLARHAFERSAALAG